MTTQMPILSVARLAAYEDLPGTLYALRSTPERAINEGKPDRIALASSHAGVHVSYGLTPAMIVHLANTMLTDDERKSITRADDPRDLIQMEMERSDDAYSQLYDATEAHNALVTDLRSAGVACAHDFGLKMVHVLTHEEGKTWRKEQRLLCVDCRESLSALVGGHDFLAPMLPDTDFHEWASDDLPFTLRGVGAP